MGARSTGGVQLRRGHQLEWVFYYVNGMVFSLNRSSVLEEIEQEHIRLDSGDDCEMKGRSKARGCWYVCMYYGLKWTLWVFSLTAKASQDGVHKSGFRSNKASSS